MSELKRQFILSFTSQFCATWAANNYLDFCQRGIQESLTTSMPVEDGAFLADRAWDKIQDLVPNILSIPEPTEDTQPHYIDKAVELDLNQRIKND